MIGISAALEVARWTVWEAEANLSPRSYSAALSGAGAQALVLPADDAIARAPEQALDLLDGLLVAGGGDISPTLYGEPEREETTGVRPGRDSFELALTRAALERDLPILGICRGMEMLNVARGGTLVQEIETKEAHLRNPGEFTSHEVELEPGSLAARAAGVERVAVRSHHHQGIGELGDGLAITGRSVGDGLAEAIEDPGLAFALGVLWHAEEESPSAVIEALAEAARRAAGVAA
ncbi:MAG TPA: gamma-glutamyl-gamma-aminobutyrate hydrolase family protein [Solirubrobacterales bacterium]